MKKSASMNQPASFSKGKKPNFIENLALTKVEELSREETCSIHGGHNADNKHCIDWHIDWFVLSKVAFMMVFTTFASMRAETFFKGEAFDKCRMAVAIGSSLPFAFIPATIISKLSSANKKEDKKDDSIFGFNAEGCVKIGISIILGTIVSDYAGHMYDKMLIRKNMPISRSHIAANNPVKPYEDHSHAAGIALQGAPLIPPNGPNMRNTSATSKFDWEVTTIGIGSLIPLIPLAGITAKLKEVDVTKDIYFDWFLLFKALFFISWGTGIPFWARNAYKTSRWEKRQTEALQFESKEPTPFNGKTALMMSLSAAAFAPVSALNKRPSKDEEKPSSLLLKEIKKSA